jgi:hypothetical protein
VSGIGPQTFRRWFHVPLMIVHPVLDECTMVVRPSCVTTNDPSTFSCQSNDFCCSWTHPKSFSPFGQVWLRNPSWSGCIFVLDAVTLGGCFAIKGRGLAPRWYLRHRLCPGPNPPCASPGCPIRFPIPKPCFLSLRGLGLALTVPVVSGECRLTSPGEDCLWRM